MQIQVKGKYKLNNVEGYSFVQFNHAYLKTPLLATMMMTFTAQLMMVKTTQQENQVQGFSSKTGLFNFKIFNTGAVTATYSYFFL